MQIDRIWSIWLCTIYEKIETAEDDKEDEGTLRRKLLEKKNAPNSLLDPGINS